jgi:hypothetical protein
MTPRPPPLLAVFAIALGSGCYLSHAGYEDASDGGREARDDAVEARDDAGAPDDAAGDDGGTEVVAPCPGDPILDAAELLVRRHEFDGRVVYVRGTVAEAGPGSCTYRPCPLGSACCNECSIGLMLAGADGTGPLLSGTGAAIPGCYGDECHLVCTPYDVGRRYVLRGTFAVVPGPGPVLAVPGGPGDVCEESPPPDHRGAYRAVVAVTSLSGDCARWPIAAGDVVYLYAGVGDPGEFQLWHGISTPPGSGRYDGTIAATGSRATFEASAHWSCCDHVWEGEFPDARAVRASLTLTEAGSPDCNGEVRLRGMRADPPPCAETLAADDCFRAGGLYGFVGPDTGELCSCPTYDGGRSCVADAECTAACLGEPVGAGCGPTGECTGGLRWAGCWCWFDAGPPGELTCWD